MPAMNEKFNENRHQFKRLLASAVMGNISVNELAEKLIPYVYESEEQAKEFFFEEEQKAFLIKELQSCEGVEVSAVTIPMISQKIEYDFVIRITYKSSDFFIEHHQTVQHAVQKLMDQLNLIAKLHQGIESPLIKGRPQTVSLEDSMYEVALEV